MGYGGFVSTNDDKIAEKIISYREFDCVDEYKPRFNFQVSDINAALGRSQIRKVAQFLRRRKLIRELYDEVFDSKGIQRQNPLIPCKYNNYRYIVRLSSEHCKNLAEHLQKKDIKTIIPIEQYELLHNYLNLPQTTFSKAERISQSTLSIPIYPALSDREINYILEAIKSF